MQRLPDGKRANEAYAALADLRIAMARSAPPAMAQTVVVDGSGKGDFSTIGEALGKPELVQKGLRIVLRPGTYEGSLSYYFQYQLDTGGLVIEGPPGFAATLKNGITAGGRVRVWLKNVVADGGLGAEGSARLYASNVKAQALHGKDRAILAVADSEIIEKEFSAVTARNEAVVAVRGLTLASGKTGAPFDVEQAARLDARDNSVTVVFALLRSFHTPNIVIRGNTFTVQPGKPERYSLPFAAYKPQAASLVFESNVIRLPQTLQPKRYFSHGTESWASANRIETY